MTQPYTLKLDRYSSHQQIANWLVHQKPHLTPQRPCVIYDLGCAQGFLGQLLPAADFTLYGVDAEPAAVASAQAYYRAVPQADLEQANLPAFPEPPDVIVLADVLEHTRRPEQCLQQIAQAYARSGTRVIISVPNIANLYIRWSLLWGRFTYTERGILDRTHLRFFTQTSAQVLFTAQPNFVLDQTTATPIPLPLVSPLFAAGKPLWLLHQLNAWGARLFPSLLGYQILLYGHVA